MSKPNRRPTHLDDISLWIYDWCETEYIQSLGDLLELDDGLDDWSVKFVDDMKSKPFNTWSEKQRRKVGELWYKYIY